MEDKKPKLKSWVANYFYAKLSEYQHYLEEVVRLCDSSLTRFEGRLPYDEKEGRLLTYAYGSLNNMVQTLKDAGSVFLPKKIGWGDIKGLRHGEFFYLSRNASTHDGNPVINTWADGRFYVGYDIERFDSYGNFIKIERPTQDVRQFTLEFSLDLYNFISDRLESISGADELSHPVIGSDEVGKIMESEIVPEDVKQLFSDNLEEMMRQAGAAKSEPIKKALSQVRSGIEFIERINS